MMHKISVSFINLLVWIDLIQNR